MDRVDTRRDAHPPGDRRPRTGQAVPVPPPASRAERLDDPRARRSARTRPAPPSLRRRGLGDGAVRGALRVATLAMLVTLVIGAWSTTAPSADRQAGAQPGVDPEEAVHAMLRRVVDAPEATAGIRMERSDPFGGPPDVERGRLWYLPGRGLRYQSERKGGHEMVIDRERDAFLVYSPVERLVYRAPFARSPLQIRRLIADPERILAKDLRSTPERRLIRGAPRSGSMLSGRSARCTSRPGSS